MSDVAQGPGWWMASDGQWYPPEQHPDRRATRAQVYPVHFDIETGDGRVARWRALAHPFMAIPHLVIVVALGLAQTVLWIMSVFTVLIVGRVPSGVFGADVMVVRYYNRVTSFLLLLREEYPPFEYFTTAEDPGDYPAITSVDEPDRVNRWLPLVKFVLIVPHLAALCLVYIGAAVAFVIGWFAVLLTGRLPEWVHTFLLGAGRWSTRVYVYALLLRDEYPPFSLEG